MKKIIAMILAAVMLCTVCGALAEEGNTPLYANVGEALDAAGEEDRIAGGEEDYYAVVTEKDGKYYRSVAAMDEKSKELYKAVHEAEDLEAAFAAAEAYLRTLPIDYTEEFTAVPMGRADMDAMVGRNVAELTEAGFEVTSSGTAPGEAEDEIIIVYTMRNGLFEYDCKVDADMEAYEKAQEDMTEGALVVEDVKLRGITHEAFLKRFHTDGTEDEPEDGFAAFGGFLDEMGEILAANVAEDGSINVEGLAEALKEKFPEQAEQIDAALQNFSIFGAAEGE